MDEFLKDFLIECSENLSKIDQDLVSLEKNPEDTEVLKTIFRAIHSIKGTCGMFGLQRLERIAHITEDVLGKMRDGSLKPTPAAVGPVLVSIDIIKSILEGIERDKVEPVGDDTIAIQNLQMVLSGQSGTESPQTAPIAAEVKEAAEIKEPIEKNDSAKSKSSVAEQSLRVNIDVLDGLMNLVGELVLTRNQLIQLVRGDDESKYHAPIQHLNRVTSGLQSTVMQTRMQPIGNAWGKLPRIVRDLTQSTGKQIELVMNGQETEIDRQILQAIQDPLIHCVRNSADHGIESTETRKQKGKPAVGSIFLNAFHEGGHIVIEIKDDGAGINVKAVREKAIERGLITKEAAEQLSDKQISNFIFEPGFSTASQVTEVSGRGVGMDVVRSNVEKIGGSIDLSSQAGVGTTLRIKIPLTLAIISALIVKAGSGAGDIFAIPQVGVLELVRVSESNLHLIEDIHGSKVLRLRDKLLPLVNLSAVLAIDEVTEKSAQELKEFSIVVAQVGDMQFGLCVHEIFDTQEIVVKPVGRLLREINLFAGSTILGDGRVVIILDTARIVTKALIKTASKTDSYEDKNSNTDETLNYGDKTTLLLFKGNDEAPLAVPLALISRLEEFPANKIENVDGRYLVQYRDGLLPLITCQNSVSIDSKKEGKIPAVIFSDGRRSMGLIVSEIVDIVEERLNIESSGKKQGILGAAIIAGRATEIIDTYYFLQTAYPDWFDGKKPSDKNKKFSILLVDDSSFFRDLLRPILESKGYMVTLACDGSQALKILESKEKFDLILSDIEMPVMDGLALAARVKQSERWNKIPMLALTSLSSPPDRQRGLDAGFSDYLVKFDQDVVLSTISNMLAKISTAGSINDSRAVMR